MLCYAQEPSDIGMSGGHSSKPMAIACNGGRVLGVTALGDNIFDAKRRAYEAVRKIRWEGAWCRKDISDKVRDLIETENA